MDWSANRMPATTEVLPAHRRMQRNAGTTVRYTDARLHCLAACKCTECSELVHLPLRPTANHHDYSVHFTRMKDWKAEKGGETYVLQL